MIIAILFLFILGTIVGSFLNVVVLRYNTGLSPFHGTSKCFSCSKRLKPYELIPLASFLILKGKCAGCGAKISWQYPIIELITGILFVLGIFFGTGFFAPVPIIVATLSIISLLVVIVVYDIRHTIIPNGMVYLFALIAILLQFLEYGSFFVWGHPYSVLLAGPILALPFAFLWFVSRGTWMGLGDAKLALGMGWFLGLAGGISAVLFAFWIGALVSLVLLAFKKSIYGRKLSFKSEIPFAPFLVLGTLIIYLSHIDFLGLSYLIR